MKEQVVSKPQSTTKRAATTTSSAEPASKITTTSKKANDKTAPAKLSYGEIKTVSSPNGYSDDLITWLDSGDAETQVYLALRDSDDVYVGITKQDIVARLKQHNRIRKNNNKPLFTDLIAVKQDAYLTRNQARAVEEYLIHDRYLQRDNLIHSVSSENPLYDEILQIGEEILVSWGVL